MGDEARCAVRYGDRLSEGKARLEPDELLFLGDFRLAIPLRAVRAVAVEDGRLDVSFADGTASFDLGRHAERWAEKIRNPKTLLDKLGVKAETRVSLVAIDDDSLLRLLRERGVEATGGEPARDSDLVFLGVDRSEDLERLGELRAYLKPNGALWVVAPKGGREPREATVLAAGKDAGLVDTKVVRFSETHTAHKFVIPVARR
jgi:hypothetical protein